MATTDPKKADLGAGLLEAWVSEAYLDDRECQSLGLDTAGSNECDDARSALRSGIVSKEAEDKLTGLGLSPQDIQLIRGPHGFKPLELYIAWLKDRVAAGIPPEDAATYAARLFGEGKLEAIRDSLPQKLVDEMVDLYVTMLGTVDPEMVPPVLSVIIPLGARAKGAVPLLIDILVSNDADAADAAQLTLSFIGQPAVADLITLLESPDAAIRARALKTLMSMKCGDATPAFDAIAKLAEDPDAEVGLLALQAIDNVIYLCQNDFLETPFPIDVPLACLVDGGPATTASCDPQKIWEQYKAAGKQYAADCLQGEEPSEHCEALSGKVPAIMQRLGVFGSSHPIFDIALHLSPDSGLDDLRSAGVFDAVADAKPLQEAVAATRSFTMLYPASGSHLAPLVIPFKLIDGGRIDHAHIVYNEIDDKALERLSLYLSWYEDYGLITGLTITSVVGESCEGPTEHRFAFQYKGKPVELVFALGCSDNDYWARESDMQQADLVVFHDGVFDEPPASMQASNFIAKLASFGDKPRFVVSENQWKLKGKKGTASISGNSVPFTMIPGAYGCTGSFIVYGHSTRMVGEKLVDDNRLSENQELPYPYHGKVHDRLLPSAVLLSIQH